MDGSAGVVGDVGRGTGGEWWYRAGGDMSGPVSSAELRRLASAGPLDGETLVWRKGFGSHWRRLVDALAPADPAGPPAPDHGRWARSFAKTEARPRRAQWSWLGLLGPVAYLWLGMWRKALVILTATMVLDSAMTLSDYGRGARDHSLPDVLTLGFCAWTLKCDYYRFKILGEAMWPRLRVLASGWVCGTLAAAAILAAVLTPLFNPVDGLMNDIAGVWQADDGNVAFDVKGSSKSVSFAGHTYAVRVGGLEDGGEGVVFDVLIERAKPITVRKRWSDDRATYTLDLFQGDELLANLAYLKPI